MADTNTGPIPAIRRDSATAPQRQPQPWVGPPSPAGPAQGFAPAPQAAPPGGGPFPPPRAAGHGPAGPPPGAPAPGTGAGPAVTPPRGRPTAFGGPHSPQLPHSPQTPQPSQARPLPPQRPLRRAGRNAVVVAFVLHQFPIGHMPVADSRPGVQLPPPAPESDGHTDLRFPPREHPRSSLVDDAEAVARVRSGAAGRRPVAEDVPIPDAMVETYEPFGGSSEGDWEHEYLARQAGDRAEYSWPPAERFPEGGVAPGEALVLEPDTVVDRIGADDGWILAPDGASFAQRSLPPAYRERTFMRYRVVRPLPVWKTVSVPWFGQPGGAVRYRATAPIAELVSLGCLVELMPAGGAGDTPTVRITTEKV